MDSDSESEFEYRSESKSLKRDSTWPRTKGSILDKLLEFPKDYSKSIIKQPPAKRARPSSASLSAIRTPEPHKNERRVHFTPPQAASPWESYQEDWRLGRHNIVTIAYKKSKQDQIYTVRRISKSQARRNLEMIRQLYHKNLVPIHEIFASQQGFFIISPYIDISLKQINGSPRYPYKPQLAKLSREVSKIANIREPPLNFPDSLRHFLPSLKGLDPQ
jgi:hypothetical protein